MRNAITAILILTVLTGCADNEHATFGAEQRAATEASATEFMERYYAHAKAGAWDSVAAVYTDDDRFFWVEDGRIAYTSADSISMALEALAASAGGSELTIGETRVTALSENVAHAYATFTQTIRDDAGQGFSFSGASTVVLVREAGRWRIVNGHTSSLKPREGGE